MESPLKKEKKKKKSKDKDREIGELQVNNHYDFDSKYEIVP